MNRLALALDNLAAWWMRRRFWPHSLNRSNKTDDSQGMRASIAALAEHPGFVYLAAQLETHKARLEAKVKAGRATRPTTMDEVIAAALTDATDSEAIFRIGWLRQIVMREISNSAIAEKRADNLAKQVPSPLGR